MADGNLSAALPARAAHPLAKPGYGKRSAPDQAPPRSGDFDRLHARAAYLANLIDRLDENAAMDAKTLAKAQPLYGQQAVRSALNELSAAGHLRRVRRRVAPVDGAATGTRWVFLTYWSRTARDDEWWARLVEGDVPGASASASAPESGARTPAESPPSAPTADAYPSTARDTLARLGLHDPRLALSAADCAALEEPAAEWLRRGVSPDHLTRVLVTGLPDHVHAPGAFVRRRLVDKLPPVPAGPQAPSVPPALMECTDCRVPGRPEALRGGLCRACRDGSGTAPPVSRAPVRAQALAAVPAPGLLPPHTVRARAADARAAIRHKEPETCGKNLLT
ncbi:hypothetical protein [Streptomyces sp. NRRL S-340]|uniref:hypothetical protein n=1 Tax=Streptomyces sp. NRRL S-340 TaxID=1463901 RepID=UPI0007C49F6F|nr:hypothetical protein [Streptomyces sp. NRRL S-340]